MSTKIAQNYTIAHLNEGGCVIFCRLQPPWLRQIFKKLHTAQQLHIVVVYMQLQFSCKFINNSALSYAICRGHKKTITDIRQQHFFVKTTTQLNDETAQLKQQRSLNAHGRCPPTNCKQLHSYMLPDTLQTITLLRVLIRK